MTWIPTVAPRTVISSSTWANPIRDHVVHTFDDVGQRNAQAVPALGMHCWVASTKTQYRWDGTGWIIMEEPWQNWATPRLWGAQATANGPDWTIRASAIQAHYRLDPASTWCRYKRSNDTVEYIGAYGFLDAAGPGTPEQILYADMPIAGIAPVYIMCGSGGGYGAGGPGAGFAPGQRGGSAYGGGNIAFIVDNNRKGTINVHTGGVAPDNYYFPYPGDSFYVSVRYISNVNYG